MGNDTNLINIAEDAVINLNLEIFEQRARQPAIQKYKLSSISSAHT